MQKWEYLFLKRKGSEDYVYYVIYPAVYKNYLPFGEIPEPDEPAVIADVFMRLGAEGWELVTGDFSEFYFKRPVRD